MLEPVVKLKMRSKINPKINFYEIEYHLKNHSLNPYLIENSKIYNLVKKLTDKVCFSSKDKYEKRWENFYLPLRRHGKIISIPFSIIKYNRDFFCYFFHLGSLHIKRRNETAEKIFKMIFQETIKFLRIIKKTNGDVVKRTVPFDFRTGKIKGKYILRELISKREKEKILQDYKQHLEKDLKIPKISLNDYLTVAGLCYKAAYKKKAESLSPLQMYKIWADGRDGGMLSIKNWNSKREFMSWCKNGKWAGSHPFEIVFSWHRHGIHLYPPPYNSWRYSLRVTNYAYAENFIRMVEALIKNKIPFIAQNLEEVLDYLAGETYFTVNDYSDNSFFYIPSQEYKRNYFKYIEWDELRI